MFIHEIIKNFVLAKQLSIKTNRKTIVPLVLQSRGFLSVKDCTS